MTNWEWIVRVMVVTTLAVGAWFLYHQKLLARRAQLMREAILNHDFMFRLPTKGLFRGERALQETLNDLGQDIARLVARHEVESWQRLTRVLTHEIMNATTPISSISQAYLAHPGIKGSPYEEGIKAIHDTCDGLCAFVDSYRKLTRLQEAVPTDINLLELLNSLRTLFGNLKWHIGIPAETIVHTDGNMLRQVLLNLVKNAVEAGAGTIDARWDGALWVSNDGAPIAADVAKDIFVPFFTTKTTGTGIGLSLSRQLMVVSGGDLQLAERPVAGYHVTFIVKTSA